MAVTPPSMVIAILPFVIGNSHIGRKREGGPATLLSPIIADGTAWFSVGPAAGTIRSFQRGLAAATPHVRGHFIRIVTRFAACRKAIEAGSVGAG